jgi:hypothetical protein
MRINGARWKLCCLIGLGLGLLVEAGWATVNFASPTSHLFIDTSITATSKLTFNKAAKVIGWGERSIVKAYGDNAASAWPEAYPDGVVISRTPPRPVTNLVDANSNAIAAIGNTSGLSGLVRTTSNAMLFGDRANSGGVGYLTAFARSSSGAIGYLTKFARANSGGVSYLTALARVSSNAMLFSDRANSGAIGYLTALARSSSGAIGYLTKFARANSGGVTYLTKFARTTSNALLLGDRVNSSAIINTNNNLMLAYGNSTALLYLNRIGSATIVYWSKTNSNALVYNIRVNSSALVYGDRVNSAAINYLSKTTSNSIYYLANTLQKNSNAINYLSSAVWAVSQGVIDNSNAITVINTTVRTTSAAVLYWNRTTSSSLLYGQRVTSNALLFESRTGSAALVYGLRTSSNAFIYSSQTTSSALVYWARTTSNALTRGLSDNSNAIVLGQRTASNALMYGTRIMSNTLLYLIDNVSDAILYLVVTMKNNSDAVVQLDSTVRTHSNAFTFGITNNSNAITVLNAGVPLVYANSNALLYLHKVDSDAIIAVNTLVANNSNALIQLDGTVRTHSNGFAYGIRNNSDAILGLISGGGSLGRANSNALLYLNRIASNADAFGIKSNSDAIVYLANSGDSGLSVANSNALLYLDRIGSQAYAYGIKCNSDAIINLTEDAPVALLVATSNAAVFLDRQLQTIDHGPNDIVLSAATFDMTHDIYLSGDHHLLVPLAFSSTYTINGHGHTIYLAKDISNMIQLDAFVDLTFQDVVLKGYNDDTVQLGASSYVYIGDGTQVEMTDDVALKRPWRFTGAVTVEGFNNRLTVQPYTVAVDTGSLLTLHNVTLQGLNNKNLSCVDNTAGLLLAGCTIPLVNNYTFSAGALYIAQDTQITGTNTFFYKSPQQSSVQAGGQLRLAGVTFKYQPPIANRDLFLLTDASSTLFLDGCTLNTTTTGMRLTRGLLLVNGKNSLINDGNAGVLSKGFCLGDGVASHDLSIQVQPGGSLNLVSGTLDYRNVN